MSTIKVDKITGRTGSGGASSPLQFAGDTLDVIKLTPTTTANAPTGTEGALYYDSDKNTLMHYDGTAWVQVKTTVNVDRPGDGEYTIDAYTKLLLHANGNGTDASGNDHTVSAIGNAFFTTAANKMGTGSLDCYTGNVQGDHFTCAPSTDFSFGTAPFTIDFWVILRDTESMANIFLLGAHNGGGEIKMRATGGGGFNLEMTDTAANAAQYAINATPSGNIPLNTWFHVAIVRQDNIISLYYNGHLEGTVSSTNSSGGNVGITMGSRNISTQNLDGCLDEVRISKGIARWNGGFTVYV